MFTVAEAVAASVLSFLAAAILAAYAGDRAGLAIHPFGILAIALAAAAITARLKSDTTPAVRLNADTMYDVGVFIAIVGGVFASLLWLARPTFLPIGSGSDLTHHLLLIDYIERYRHLVHDAALGPYLGEMADYTAGAHLLAVFAGAWSGRDALHALYPMLAFTVALKAGFVFLITRRMVRRDRAAVPLACLAVLLLFLPRDYFLGSFTHSSFLAQVVAEMFAVGMWWAAVAWNETPTVAAAFLFGLAGAAAFLTWPVWIGALSLLFVGLISFRRALSWHDRLVHAAFACLPIIAAAVVHSAGRVGAAAIASAGGFAIRPTPATVGWPFVLLAALGTIVRRARSSDPDHPVAADRDCRGSGGIVRRGSRGPLRNAIPRAEDVLSGGVSARRCGYGGCT